MRLISSLLGSGWLTGGLTGCLDDRRPPESARAKSGRSSYFESKKEGLFQTVESPSYAGKLVVWLESGEAIERVRQKFPGVTFARSVERSFEEEEKYHAELETKTGKNFVNWNRVYRVEAKNPEEAKALMEELGTTPEVRMIYPDQKSYPAHAEGTPNLDDTDIDVGRSLQTYLNGTDQGGLNIRPAWAQGVFGAGVFLGIDDGGINFRHEEFDPEEARNWEHFCRPESVRDFFGSDCRSEDLAHGMATTGMIKAQHGEEGDPHGIRGIAPGANVATAAHIRDASRMPPGSVLLLEVGKIRNEDGRLRCQNDASGLACVPIEAFPDFYGMIREATEVNDVLVVSPAGNGGIDFDAAPILSDEALEEVCGPREDPSAEECWQGSGSLLVGASAGDRGMVGTGADAHPVKREFSNCGEAVKAFGWGERVVTTAWQSANGAIPGYDWDPVVVGGMNLANADGNSAYTNQFGGTSAAAVMLAGAAVLVQSYFKDIANGTPAGDGSYARFRYIRPDKLQEILGRSGVEAVAQDGCGIGKQPRMDEALRLTREFWEQTVARYPELNTPELPKERMDQLYEEEKVGLVCVLGEEAKSDPSCPDSVVHPPLECENYHPRPGKKVDIDGDGRGDLVSWSPVSEADASLRVWKIDLSSVKPRRGERPEPDDNYGEWDVTLHYDPVGKWEIPVVEDYDSDGRADLAVYDRESGRWKIAVTDDMTLWGNWHGWDHVVEWPGRGDSARLENEFYTRPLPADYNNDRWPDLAAVDSEGHWKINYGWRQGEKWEGCKFENHGPEIPAYEENAIGRWTSPGVWDLAYLTEEELAEYPGWAYLPAVDQTALAWRGNDGVVKTLSISGRFRSNLGEFGLPPLGDISNMPVSGSFPADGGLGVKSIVGIWQYYGTESNLIVPVPNGIFGGSECKPVVADFDADGFDDRAVMCPDGWRIVYSGNLYADQNNEEGFCNVPLGFTHPGSLPGQPVFGGLPFDRVMQVRQFLQDLGMDEMPPLFDYAMVPYQYCGLPWHVDDQPEECAF